MQNSCDTSLCALEVDVATLLSPGLDALAEWGGCDLHRAGMRDVHNLLLLGRPDEVLMKDAEDPARVSIGIATRLDRGVVPAVSSRPAVDDRPDRVAREPRADVLAD